MVTVNNPINNTVGGSNSGVTNTLTITNSSNTASSQAQELISVGGSSAGDAYTTYTISGITSWSQGIDNSANDAYVLAVSNTLGTSNTMSVSTAGAVSFPLGNVDISRAGAGNDISLTIDNSSNSASSSSSIYLTVAGSSAFDAKIQYAVSATTTWTQGLDNSASDAFVLAASNTLGTTNVMSAATTGAVSFLLGNLDVTRSASGADVAFTTSNTSNTASSTASHYLTVAGTSAGDAQTQYAISGTTTWTQGIDNSASDAFVLSASNALGTTNVMSAATTGAVSYPLGNVDITRSASGSNVSLTISNTSNTASSQAKLQLTVAGLTAADPYIGYTATGFHDWTQGIDNSASGAFVLSSSSTLGSNNVIKAAIAGDVSVEAGNFSVNRSGVGLDVSATVSNTSNIASSTATQYITVGGTSAGDAQTQYAVSGTTTWTQGIDNSASDAFVIAASNTLGTSNVLSVTTAGELTYPLQPAFLVYVNTTISNVTGDGTTYTMIYDTEVFDQNSDFNLGTGTFTAPVTGRYDLRLGARLSGGTSITSPFLSIETSNRSYTTLPNLNPGATTTISGSASVLADMDAGDTAIVTIGCTDSGGKVDDVSPISGAFIRNWFSGNLVA